MPLATRSADRLTFDKAAIMRRAFQHARFALMICHTAAQRNEQRSRALRKAWAEAKREAASLIEAARREVEARAALAQRAREAVALAARFGNDPEAISFEIEREHYRQHFNGARIDALRGALDSIGASA